MTLAKEIANKIYPAVLRMTGEVWTTYEIGSLESRHLKELEALVGAELEERNKRIDSGLCAGRQALSKLRLLEPELVESPVKISFLNSVLAQGELNDYDRRLNEARALLKEGDE